MLLTARELTFFSLKTRVLDKNVLWNISNKRADSIQCMPREQPNVIVNSQKVWWGARTKYKLPNASVGRLKHRLQVPSITPWIEDEVQHGLHRARADISWWWGHHPITEDALGMLIPPTSASPRGPHYPKKQKEEPLCATGAAPSILNSTRSSNQVRFN